MENKVYLTNRNTGEDWEVVTYIKGDVLFLVREVDGYYGRHLFADNIIDVSYAKEVFDFDLV